MRKGEGIDIFKPQEYWDLKIELIDDNKNKISCSLIMDGEKKYDKFTLNTKEKAESVKKSIENQSFYINSIDKERKKEVPILPFLTLFYFRMHHQNWVLAQKHTNSIAQELKDGIGSLGALITYHRTDSNKMKDNEIEKIKRSMINNDYGKEFLSENKIIYKEKSKFVQQGHEAVTPTEISKKPEELKNLLNTNQLKLYELIWKRTVASQMKPSINLETTYFIKSDRFLLKAHGSIEKFKGFKNI